MTDTPDRPERDPAPDDPVDLAEPDLAEPDLAEPDLAEPDALDQPATSVEAARLPAAGDPPHRQSHLRASALIGVLTLLLGFAIAVQFRSNSTGDALAGARPDDLISILDDQNREATRLRTRITDLQGTLQKLRDAGTNGPAARAEAQSQADGLGILTGTVPATGPGVVVTVTDPTAGLKAEDLLDVVEELRGAGAEAIQFGPVRVGMTSSFSDVDGNVVLDGTTLVGPYVVRAIGPGSTMQTALEIPGGVAAVVRNAGGTATITRTSSITITVLRVLAKNKYARPAAK